MRAWMTAALAALAAAILVGAGWLAMRPDAPRGGVAVLGDEAPALHRAMGTAQALPLHTAAVTVVSLQGWDRLRYISDMAALCGEDCTGEAAFVRVVPLSPTGSRKVLFVNLDAWPGTVGLTRPTEEKDFACIAETLLAEFERLRATPPPDCAAGLPIEPGTRWVLPVGLGAF